MMRLTRWVGVSKMAGPLVEDAANRVSALSDVVVGSEAAKTMLGEAPV